MNLREYLFRVERQKVNFLLVQMTITYRVASRWRSLSLPLAVMLLEVYPSKVSTTESTKHATSFVLSTSRSHATGNAHFRSADTWMQ
jgi:hypothetical protein